MNVVFLRLVNMSIAAGWLILAVIVLRVLFKNAPKTIRCVLWAFVGIRLIFPFPFESAWSLIPSVETISPDMLYSEKPIIHTGITLFNKTVNPAFSETLAPEIGAKSNPLQIITSAASVFWLIGVAALLLYAVISYLRLHRRVYAAMWLRDNIWLCDHVTSPFILGILKPRIYFPSILDEQILSHAAAHENAHLKRLDHWWKPIGFLLLTVYWFNPLIWLAYILLCRDIELACDERVVKELGFDEKKAYSDALLSCSVTRRMIAACPTAFGEVGVKERIRNVLHYKKPAFWIVAMGLVACAAIAWCFLTNPKEITLYAPDPFCHTYQVERIAYDAPQYSFTYTPDSAPSYCLSADFAVLVKEGANDWLALGSMQPAKLTKDNFDLYFDHNGNGGWQAGLTARSLRRGNDKVWKMVTSDASNAVFYYLLLQKNGDIYMTYGYLDTESETYPKSDDSNIRWLFKLRIAETAYVTSECLYMNPLSSYLAIGGDSGYRYIIGVDAFTMINKNDGSIISIPSIEWNWQEFPYTDDEWAALFVPSGFDTLGVSGMYHEMLYQPLSDQYSLFRMDGQLWLADMRENAKMGKYLWSIYALVPESGVGSVK